MPIPLPNLDDRRYSDLVEEMQTLLPRYAQEWTDHNVSDPGIMLIELFAWLTEALIYRLNRIPEASVARMVELLGTRSPRSIRICTLLDKAAARVKDVPIHYRGFEIPDRFVIGYGLDYDEIYRNLPYIGVLKPEVYGGA